MDVILFSYLQGNLFSHRLIFNMELRQTLKNKQNKTYIQTKYYNRINTKCELKYSQ